MDLLSKTLIFMLLISVLFLAFLAFIGVYVYRDARRRGMNAVLWTLVAIAAPALIGFIIYLLVRGGYADLECPRCGAPVMERYVACPQCGTKLRPACPSCSGPVEPDWKVCPYCAAPLDGVGDSVSPPLRRQDKALNKILIAVIAAAVLVIALMVLGFSAYSIEYGSGSLMELTFDEYDQAQKSEEIRGAVHDWLDGLETRSDRAYALQYNYYDEFDAKNKYYYLIYVPSGGKSPTTSFGSRTGLFGSRSLDLRLENTGYSGSLYVVSWQTTDDRPPRPSVTLGGKRIPCEVRTVDYNPTTYLVIPNYANPESWDGQLLPERLSVVKLVGGESIGTADDGTAIAAASKNAGVAEVTDRDMMFKILSAIDSGARVPMEQIPDFDFHDGFEIIVEYQIHDEYIMHDNMARHMVFMENGVCYLDDSRVRSTTHGSSFRVMDEDFYRLLGGLFEGGQ